MNYTDLEIIESDKYAVEYHLDGSRKPVCNVESGKLVFKEAKSGTYVNFGFNLPVTSYADNTYVRLYVPENIEFDTIKINADDGDIKLPALKAESMEIINDYGDVELDTFDGDRINVEIQDGKMSAEKIISDRMKADNEYGDIDIQMIKCKTLEATLNDGAFTAGNYEGENARIENEYGDVNFTLAGDAKEYSLDLTTEYGGITIPGYEEFNGGDGARRKVENESGREITVICQDGDINLTTAK